MFLNAGAFGAWRACRLAGSRLDAPLSRSPVAILPAGGSGSGDLLMRIKFLSVAFGVGTTFAFAADAIAVVTVHADLAMELSKALALPSDESLLQVVGGSVDRDALGGVLDRTGLDICSVPFMIPEALDIAAVLTIIDWACAKVLDAEVYIEGFTGDVDVV